MTCQMCFGLVPGTKPASFVCCSPCRLVRNHSGQDFNQMSISNLLTCKRIISRTPQYMWIPTQNNSNNAYHPGWAGFFCRIFKLRSVLSKMIFGKCYWWTHSGGPLPNIPWNPRAANAENYIPTSNKEDFCTDAIGGPIMAGRRHFWCIFL
jgi:hypothetical protein